MFRSLLLRSLRTSAGLLLLASAPHLAAQDVTPTKIIRARQFAERDSALAARHQGGLVMVVRNVDRPEQPLPAALVRLCVGQCDDSTLSHSARIHADAVGVARVHPLIPGEYELLIHAVGHQPARTRIVVTSGCVGRVEVYLSVFPFSTVPLDLTRARVVHTTCAIDA